MRYNKSVSEKTKSLLKNISKILVAVLVMLLPVFVAHSPVSASSAPVQFTIPNTRLTIKGFASPGAFVQIVDGNALVGTVLADSNGVFEKNFSAMRAGLHRFRITYQDRDGLTSDPLVQTVNVRAQSDTAVEYFLPPTLAARPVSATEGELVTFSGSTIPNAIVEISLDGGVTVLRPQSGPDGRYSISVDTTGYYFGEHNATATSSQGGLTSHQTLKEKFIILPVQSNAGNNSGALTPPIITSIDGEIESGETPILIRGTGPPNTQIIIYLNGEPIGSTFTNADGNWFFNLDVSATSQDIRAIACDGDVCSDFSNLTTVLFTGDPERCSTHRFWLSEYRYWGVDEGDGIDLNITGVSGTPPYEVILDWGDSITERFNRNSAQSYSLHHVYQRTGNYSGSISIADDTGCQYTRYFSVSVIEKPLDNRWFFGIAGGIILLAIWLRHRYHIHRKKLILAR